MPVSPRSTSYYLQILQDMVIVISDTDVGIHGDDEAPLKEKKKPGKKSGKRSSANLVFVITSNILTYFYVKEPPFYYI